MLAEQKEHNPSAKFTRAKSPDGYYETEQIKGRLAQYYGTMIYTSKTKIKVITPKAEENKFVRDAIDRGIEEILCFAKLDSGSVKPEKEDIEMSEFLQDCLMPFEGTILSRGLEVSLGLSPMTVFADPDKLEHAVSNLLTNALKYAKT